MLASRRPPPIVFFPVEKNSVESLDYPSAPILPEGSFVDIPEDRSFVDILPKKSDSMDSLDFPGAIIQEQDEILDRLWLGKYPSQEFLRNNCFTHVISLVVNNPKFSDNIGINNLWIPIADRNESLIHDHFDACFQFINQAKEKGGKIYVHCKAGISRSPTIIIAYIMMFGTHTSCYHHTFTDAKDYVRSKRPTIAPNYGFINVLEAFEIEIKRQESEFR